MRLRLTGVVRRRMGRPVRAGGMLILGVMTASAAAAIPPPPSIQIFAISSDQKAQALAEAYVTFLAENGGFERARWTIARSALRPCFAERESGQACIREALKTAGAAGPVVVIAAAAEADGRQRWECVGTGGKPTSAGRQEIETDLRAGFFGSDAERMEQRNKATGCILAAAAESGW